MIRKLKLSGAILSTLMFAFSIGISIMVLTWIDKLEKTACKCSEDFKREYIKYYLYSYIALYTLMYLITMYMIFYDMTVVKYSFVMVFVSIFKYIVPVFAIINTIFSIMYIWKLKEIDCKCSEDIRREIYYVLNWINVGFLGLTIVLVFFIAIVWTAAFGYAYNTRKLGSTSSISKSSSK